MASSLPVPDVGLVVDPVAPVQMKQALGLPGRETSGRRFPPDAVAGQQLGPLRRPVGVLAVFGYITLHRSPEMDGRFPVAISPNSEHPITLGMVLPFKHGAEAKSDQGDDRHHGSHAKSARPSHRSFPDWTHAVSRRQSAATPHGFTIPPIRGFAVAGWRVEDTVIKSMAAVSGSAGPRSISGLCPLSPGVPSAISERRFPWPWPRLPRSSHGPATTRGNRSRR